MEKFTIEEVLPVEGRNRYLLNQPFQQRRNEDDFDDSIRRISSYHDPLSNEADWLVYTALPSCKAVFVRSARKYSCSEAILFMAEHNGIGMTRDNLFMLPTLFPQRKWHSSNEVLAPMAAHLLPSHNSGSKIVPRLGVSTKDISHTFHYDWWWYGKVQELPMQQFVFLQPILHKQY